MIEAIFFDIDGTLVSFTTHRVPASAATAIKACQARGIKVFICTGRPGVLVQDFTLPQYGGLVFDGIVAQNGAYCAAGNGEVFFKNSIDRRDIAALIKFLANNEPFPVSVMTENAVYINYLDERVLALAQTLGVAVPRVFPLEQIDREVMQVNIYGGLDLEEKVMREVFRSCDSSRWHPHFADVTPRGNDKATGIDKMLSYYGIDLSATMAFGDGANDIPMLRHVHTGVAMGNSDDLNVFRAAKYIAPHIDEDGIARFLDSFFLHL